MSGIAVGTVIAKNFLSFGRVIARSFLRHHSCIPFFTLCTEDTDGRFDPEREAGSFLRLEDVGVPELHRLRFAYSRQQLVVAAKPYLLGHLLNLGYRTVVFLDADMVCLDDLSPLLEQAQQHALTLTPHLLGPLAGARRTARELNILRSGIYNGGFAAVTESIDSRRFLAWWQDRLWTHCMHDPAAALHFDQRWLDFAPGFVGDFSVVRDPGCNVAYWNLPERAVKVKGSQVTADGVPCRFFHFSGFEPDRPEQVTRYWPHIAMNEIGEAAEIFRRYCALLQDAGYEESKAWPYQFDHFTDGTPIPGIVRRIYHEMGEEGGRFGDPMQTGPGSFLEWLNEPSGAVTRVWQGIYDRRPDVRLSYPDIRGVDQEAFRRWTQVSGAREHAIPAAMALTSP